MRNRHSCPWVRQGSTSPFSHWIMYSESLSSACIENVNLRAHHRVVGPGAADGNW